MLVMLASTAFAAEPAARPTQQTQDAADGYGRRPQETTPSVIQHALDGLALFQQHKGHRAIDDQAPLTAEPVNLR